MRANRRTYGSRFPWWPPSPAAMSAFVIVAGVGTLWATGVINPATLLGRPQQDSRAGMVAVPVSARAIPAYEQLTRDHLWNPKQGELSVIYLRPKQVAPEMIRDLGQIIGRVLRYEKPPGYVFTENDFFPKGTRPGLVAGIPPGKRALRVDAERVFGLQGLHQGDHFDLLSAIPLDPGRGNMSQGTGIYAQQMEMEARLGNWQKQATVMPLVQNGLIVQAVSIRTTPTTSSSLMRGTVNGSKPVQEVVIAVDPDEVVRLTEALAVSAQILCLPRSGRPGDDESVTVPALAPKSPFSGGNAGPAAASMTMIETINGSKRQMIAAPGQR